MMRTKNTALLFALLLPVALSAAACSSVKEELGVGRNSPDEFLVVKRAPLTLPPDYTLRPPADAYDVQPSQETASKAKAALLGTAPSSVEKGSGDEALLQKLGADTARADIRRTIDEENGYISLKNRTVAEKLIFWNDEEPSLDKTPSSVVDPAAEAERIKKNQADGKPINDGKVPVIEKKKGTLDKIF